jgi:hypothetical protein
MKLKELRPLGEEMMLQLAAAKFSPVDAQDAADAFSDLGEAHDAALADLADREPDIEPDTQELDALELDAPEPDDDAADDAAATEPTLAAWLEREALEGDDLYQDQHQGDETPDDVEDSRADADEEPDYREPDER